MSTTSIQSDKEYKGIQKIQSLSPNKSHTYFQQTQKQHNYFNQPNQQKKAQNNNDNQKNSYILNKKKSPEINEKNNLSQQQNKNKSFLLEDSNYQIYDCISTFQLRYEKLLLCENLLFYYKSCCDYQENQNKEYKKMDGKLYQTNFDENKNPKFKIQEGSFSVNLSKQKFVLSENGIEYLGKSNTIKNSPIRDYDDGNNKRSKSAPNTKIVIIDVSTGLQVNKNYAIRNNKNELLSCWCKYNQQFCKKDNLILSNKGRLTSSIIDGYVMYLNLESERIYFKMQQRNRQEINRILLLPSTLTTNFGKDYSDQHSKLLFETELLEFQELNYELERIYSYIGMPVNQNNYHWYFLLFDLKQKICTIFDSLQQPNINMNIDQKLLSTLEKLLKIKDCKRELSLFSGQQFDGYSCGYHVCQFMKYCNEKQFQSNVKYNYNQSEITEILLKVIQQQQQ
ncbi:unnamed protein product [Paramecium pentaurelia]|uniref:Ubiquitin-like protease family profile domain-containing protein n=1 Tax=Paramecium pentaurelia TaxID=43138 RepID=A0A8S1YAJ6_9CILI|nr:unnamed protein product [Paramecium pentaurelia]